MAEIKVSTDTVDIISDIIKKTIETNPEIKVKIQEAIDAEIVNNQKRLNPTVNLVINTQSNTEDGGVTAQVVSSTPEVIANSVPYEAVANTGPEQFVKSEFKPVKQVSGAAIVLLIAAILAFPLALYYFFGIQ